MHLRAWACMDAADSRALSSGPLRHTGASSPGVRRAPGPSLQGLLALAIYLAPFAWYALPLIRYLDLPVVGHLSPDSNFYIWSMRWLPYAISHGLNPLYSNQIMAPGGISLAWSTPTPTVVIVMWPLTAAFGPVLSYNLALLLAPPVTGVGGVRRRAPTDWPVLGVAAGRGRLRLLPIHGYA
jgi:hypothetical protein